MSTGENNAEYQEEPKGNQKSLNEERNKLIESMSKKNATGNKADNAPKKRWDYLYSQSYLQKEKIEKIKKQNSEKKEKELLEECTFSPKINKNIMFLKNDKSREIVNESSTDPFSYVKVMEKRQLEIEERRSKKMKEIQKNKNNKEIEECCFNPELVNYINIYNF